MLVPRLVRVQVPVAEVRAEERVVVVMLKKVVSSATVRTQEAQAYNR